MGCGESLSDSSFRPSETLPSSLVCCTSLDSGLGFLNNLTFDQLPLSRLTASDITKRSGAITTLVVILAIVTVLAINQARVIRKTVGCHIMEDGTLQAVLSYLFWLFYPDFIFDCIIIFFP